MCKWKLSTDDVTRRDRKGAYQDFLAAIRLNLNNASAYTALGVFYADYADDDRRARKCFSKAFELSPSEFEAARRLAESFAASQEWDLVEIVAQRVVDTGKLRIIPGSKKDAISWPFSALGVVHLNKPDYNQAIIAFNACLRLAPTDYHALIGLGEAYHHSGRYVSAAKCFERAQTMTDPDMTEDAWFARFMLANVRRELGEYEQAIVDYQEVLQDKPGEAVVVLSLIKCLVENSWYYLQTGFSSRASSSASRALEEAVALITAGHASSSVWRHAADACSIFSWTGGVPDEACHDTIQALLRVDEKPFPDSFTPGPRPT